MLIVRHIKDHLIPEVSRVSDPSPAPSFILREACRDDLESVLALNREWEHATSPLTLEELRRLHDLAALHLVALDGGSVVAFALALGPGVVYDSPNYRWFDRGPGDFLYVDRVVVDSAAQGSGIGGALYARVFDRASARGASRVVCEVDVEPLNAVSDEFHRRWGFVEVGTQLVAGDTKRVSLRECTLA